MNKQEFLEKYVTDRHGTDCSKWDGLEGKFGEKDLLAMWVADMEFKTCDAIVDAMTERVKQGYLATALCRTVITIFFQIGWRKNMVLL